MPLLNALPFRVAGRIGFVRRPAGARRGPAVVLLPGAVGGGRFTLAFSPLADALCRAGFLVAAFHARGRRLGTTADFSGRGRLNLNGFADQDDLAAVIRWLAARPDVTQVGVLSYSYGLAAAAGCLGRYPELPVRFLIDEEGPSDRFAVTLQAWGLGGMPDWPARAALLFGDPPEGEAAFWAEREPIRFIGGFRGAYLRIQGATDHVQPPDEPQFHHPPRWSHNHHARALLSAALAGGVPEVWLNGERVSGPLPAALPWRRGPLSDAQRVALVQSVLKTAAR